MKHSHFFNWLWTNLIQPTKKLWLLAFLSFFSYQQGIGQILNNTPTESGDGRYEIVEGPLVTRSPAPDSLKDMCDQLIQSVLNQDHHVFKKNYGVNINKKLFLDSYTDDEWFKSRLALWDEHWIATHILDLKIDAKTGDIYYSIWSNDPSVSSLWEREVIEWYYMLLKKAGILVYTKNLHISPSDTLPKRKLFKI